MKPQWFNLDPVFIKSLPYMYWFRETYTDIICVVIDTIDEKEVNWFDVRTYGALLLILALLILTPVVAFYARYSTIKDVVNDDGGEKGLMTRNKKNAEYLGIFTTLKNGR